jgi:transcription elongation factor Elf1
MSLPVETEEIFEMLRKGYSKEEITDQMRHMDGPTKESVKSTKTPDIVCPWCGDKQNQYLGLLIVYQADAEVLKCNNCGRIFDCSFSAVYTFTTRRKER